MDALNPRERVTILFLGLRHDSRNAPSCFNSSPETLNHKRQEGWHKHVLNWGELPLGVQILYTLPTPKIGIKQIEQFSDIISHLAVSCGVVWSHKVGTLSTLSFVVNSVSAGVRTPPDSGKTPQLKTSKTGTKLW